eukprot:TRINITY_DN3016_c0_g1_i1.p1 TRINITY_DN3016_c0_g1~~TRINITY_DN3016_c0_g1_i1.p1  ORF type:complete len:418 (-),score=170.93 TRINITY_DN3016_c0_g1_i1:177-1304(-)
MSLNRTIRRKQLKKKKEKQPNFSAQDFLTEAENAIEMFEYETAVNCYYKALELEPKNTKIMDDLGEILLEMGDLSNAYHMLKQSIHFAPNEGWTKYLNFGQLLSAADAVASFQKGIELMVAEKQKPEKTAEEIEKINKQLCNACCSVAEIYMTDLCDEPSAEKNCSDWVQRAIEVDAANPEGYQSLANLSLSQNNKQKAGEALQKSISLWLEKEREEWPSLEFRTATSKLLMELGENEKAAELLEEMMEENDQVIDQWFLLGFAYSLFDPSSSRRCLLKALEMIEKDPIDNENVKSEIEKILQKLPAEANEEEMGGGGAEEEGEENEDDWVDVDEGEELLDEEEDDEEQGEEGNKQKEKGNPSSFNHQRFQFGGK